MDSMVAPECKRDNYYSNINHVYIMFKGKMILRKKLGNVKSDTYGNKGVIRHYNYRSDSKLVLGIVAIIIIPCSCHS